MPEDDGEEIHEEIEALREEAPNEQVEQLLDVIESVYIEAKHADSKADNLNRRVRHLQEYTGATLSEDAEPMMSPEFDHRDEAVLKTLVARNPETVGVKKLQKIYKRRTDVRDKETLRDRVKELTTQGPFEYEGSSKWRFTAHTEEESETTP